jgi:hypothetical protein
MPATTVVISSQTRQRQLRREDHIYFILTSRFGAA